MCLELVILPIFFEQKSRKINENHWFFEVFARKTSKNQWFSLIFLGFSRFFDEKPRKP